MNEQIAVKVTRAAELLDTSPDTIERLVAKGHLPRVPHVGRILIPTRALREFAELGMVGAA